MTKKEEEVQEFLKVNNFGVIPQMLENLEEKSVELLEELERMAKASGIEEVMDNNATDEEKKEWYKYWMSNLNRADQVLSAAIHEIKTVKGVYAR